MSTIKDEFDSVFRDYVVSGVPASGAHEPIKQDIRALGRTIDTTISTFETRVDDEIDTLGNRVAAVETIAAAGVNWTPHPIRVRSTGHIPVSTDLQNSMTLNGVTLATGDNVFLGLQADPVDNGIYTVVASGPAARATFADSAAKLARIGFVVLDGTDGAGERWTLPLDEADITVGATPLDFAMLGLEVSVAGEVTAARGGQASLGDRLDRYDDLADAADTFGTMPSNVFVHTDDRSVDATVLLSGGLRISTSGSDGLAGIQSRLTDTTGTITVEMDITVTSATIVRGIGFAIGTGSARRWYVWGGTGGLVWYPQAGTASANVLLSSDPSRSYDQDDKISIKVAINADRTGTITIRADDGGAASANVSGVPTGPLYLAVRASSTFTITEMRHSGRVSTLEAEVEQIRNNLLPSTLRSRGFKVLPTPQSLAPRDPPGFTCTGADRFSTGPLAGCFVVGDDGRLRDSGSDPYKRRLHIYDSQFVTVLQTLILPNETQSSVQGVAADPWDGSLWVAFPTGDGHIRHFAAPAGSLDGAAVAAVEIAADAISWSSLGLTGQPNGLAFDTDHGGAVWATRADAGTAWQIDCDPLASPRILQTITLAAGAPDQLQYLPATDAPDGQARLIYTVGSNGFDGQVRVYNLTTGQDRLWSQLPRVQAIEQFWWDSDSNIGLALSDGGFHVAARPQINAAHFFEMPQLP